MRPTGFGVKAPADASADFEYPQRKPDGTILDMTYKSLTEQRRELLYLAKLGYTVDRDLFHLGSQSKSPTRDQ